MDMTLKTQIPLYIVIASIGLIIGLLIKGPMSSSKNRAQEQQISDNIADEVSLELELNSFKNEIKNLKQQVTEGTKISQELQTNLDTLQNKVAQLSQISTKVEVSQIPEDDNKRIYKTSPRPPMQQTKEWFNYDALIVAGVETSEANRLRNLYDGIEIEKLYLRDRAIREKWINSDKYRKEIGTLEDKYTSLRSELDDTTYDAFLYASGRSNRVVVQSVLSTSPAGEAGIQAGDQIIRYGNNKIYTWSDLRTATTSGQANELVEIIIDRAGKKMSLYIPRGPLGIRLDNQSTKP
jgi:hypothetical protein